MVDSTTGRGSRSAVSLRCYVCLFESRIIKTSETDLCKHVKTQHEMNTKDYLQTRKDRKTEEITWKWWTQDLNSTLLIRYHCCFNAFWDLILIESGLSGLSSAAGDLLEIRGARQRLKVE